MDQHQTTTLFNNSNTGKADISRLWGHQEKKVWETWTIFISTLKSARTGNGHLQCNVLLDLWLLLNDNHVHFVQLASAPSLPSWQRNKSETIVSNPKCFQWQCWEVQYTPSLHWYVQGHTGQAVKRGNILGAAQAATDPNSPIATPGQVLRIPRLFTNSRTTFSPHS